MGLCFYGFVEITVKTTVELPDDLLRQAKVRAALTGRRLKDLVAEGLRLALAQPEPPIDQAGIAALMEATRGVVSSGVPDLASNPAHLEGFGRDSMD